MLWGPRTVSGRLVFGWSGQRFPPDACDPRPKQSEEGR